MLHGCSGCPQECSSGAQCGDTKVEGHSKQDLVAIDQVGHGDHAVMAEDDDADGWGLAGMAAVKSSKSTRSNSPSPKKTIDVLAAPAQVSMKEKRPDARQPDDWNVADTKAPSTDSRSSKDVQDSRHKRKWGPRLDEAQIMQEGNWLCYACCCGLGRSSEIRPLQYACTVCCIQQLWRTVPFWHEKEGGVCGFIQSCCCAASFCVLPPREEHPKLVLCGRPCGGTMFGKRRSWREVWNEYDAQLDKFVPLYCCCAGVGCVPQCMTCIASVSKCGCCLCKCRPRANCPEGPFTCTLNCWSFVGACRIPPVYDMSPICACCGCKLKHRIEKCPQPRTLDLPRVDLSRA